MGIFSRKPNIEKLKAKRDVGGLIKAHKHEDYYVSRYAESALLELIDDSEATGDVETLIRIFEGDKEARMSVASIFAEGTIKDKRVVEPFIKALKDDEAGEGLRVTIVSALAKIKDERAVELLIEILRKDRAEGMRRVAAEALGEIGDGRASKPLKEALKDKEVGAAVKDALKKIQKGVKKKEEGETKQYRYANPNLMARAEKEAMAKENLREALKALTSIYNESGGPRFAGLENYIAGKLDACGVVEQHLRRDKGYTKAALRKMEEYDAGRPGDTFNQGRREILSWALARLEENA